MLLLNDIRNNKEEIISRLDKRMIDAAPILEEILQADDRRKGIQKELDDLLAESNRLSKDIGMLYKSGKAEEANAAKAKTAEIKEASKDLSHKLKEAENAVQELLLSVPNAPHADVPKGRDEKDNLEVKRHGEIPTMPEDAKPHWDLCKEYDLIDFELGVKITGAGFPVYKNQGARLQRALISYFLDYNTRAGYKEYLPPHFVNAASGFGTGQLPDKEGQMYHMQNDDLYAIPTAEVPITNIFRDEILNKEDLPIQCTAYTPCFRREAGSYGKDVRGLNRLHQFDKVEIVNIAKPEDSYTLLDQMVDHVAKLLDSLELPYRILKLCGGDTGFAAAITYDFEVYSSAQKRWLEVSSVSNFETFQANRLKLRYRGEDKKTHLCHTLNGSSLALPRIVASILENHQKEGFIHIPEILIPYTGFDKISK